MLTDGSVGITRLYRMCLGYEELQTCEDIQMGAFKKVWEVSLQGMQVHVQKYHR